MPWRCEQVAEGTTALLDPPQRSGEALRVGICGTGAVTALGTEGRQTWENLLQGRYITDHARAVGRYDGSEARVVQLAQSAAREAMGEAGWSVDEDFAVVVGTSKGPVDAWLEHGSIDNTGLGEIAAALGRGARLTVSGACASGLMALVRATLMIRCGEAKRVLVVASESSLHPLFLASFRRLGVLPGAGVGCRPFDLDRDGFLLSEAAAAVCLEAVSSKMEVGGQGGAAPVLVDRVAMGGDASHLTAADPEGGLLRHLLREVIDGRLVDLVHAHGTGTVANDPIELAAIEATAEGASVYSHKGALGHSLGASGLLAVVLNVMAHERGVIPPNVRTAHPIGGGAVRLDQQAHGREIRRSVALAAGFGGAAAAVSLISSAS